MTTHTSMLHIRVDNEIKAQATEALDAIGLSVSDAVRLFLRRVVVDQAFPIELKVPNATTRIATKESKALFDDLGNRPGTKTWNEFFELLHSIQVPEDFMTDRPMNALSENSGIFDDALDLQSK